MGLKERARDFSGRRITVLGDIIADEYLLAQTDRISREAPVPILKYRSRELSLGGAANAAHNVKALGGDVSLVGIVGEDHLGKEILKLLETEGVDTQRVIRAQEAATTCKTRILAGGFHTTKHQILRIDRESEGEYAKTTTERLLASLEEALQGAEALVVSDYGLGVVKEPVVAAVNRLAERALAASSNPRSPLVTVDSRHNLLAFRGITALTPNELELQEVIDNHLPEDRIFQEGEALRRRLGARGLLLTRGSRGMVLFEAGEEPRPIGIFGLDKAADGTGAGDTVISAFTLAQAAGASMWEAAQLANIAGGLVVMKRGTATVSARELLEAL